MPECDWADLACQAGAGAASILESGAGVSSILESFARTVGEATADMLRFTFTWWIEVDSISPDSDVIRSMQEYTMPVAALILTGSVLVQAIRMTLARKKDPAINVALGLIRFAVVNAVGLTVLAAALRAGDAYAEWMLRDAVRDYVEPIAVALGVNTVANPLFMLALGGIGAILAFIQFFLAFFRQAGILVLAAMLTVAATGSGSTTRLGLWLVALVLYKPMAATIYVVGIRFMGDEDDLAVAVVGVFVLLLAVVAMPAMMRFFAWSRVSVTGGSGVGGAFAAGASAAATTSSLVSARRHQMTGPGSVPTASSAPAGASPAAAGTTGSPAGGAPGGGAPGGGAGAGGGAAGGVAAAYMAYQATKATAEKFTSEVASGAGSAPQAGAPSARGGGASPAGATGTSGPSGGSTGMTGSGGGSPGAAAGGARSGTPTGGGAAGAVAAARAAQQGAQGTANKMTGEEQRG